jgi:hypothetical protein
VPLRVVPAAQFAARRGASASIRSQ